MKTEQQVAEDWLPVVEFNGVLYVVNIAMRQFKEFNDPDCSVEFHSDKGREITRSLLGTKWRAFTHRDLWEKNDEQVV